MHLVRSVLLTRVVETEALDSGRTSIFAAACAGHSLIRAHMSCVVLFLEQKQLGISVGNPQNTFSHLELFGFRNPPRVSGGASLDKASNHPNIYLRDPRGKQKEKFIHEFFLTICDLLVQIVQIHA